MTNRPGRLTTGVPRLTPDEIASTRLSLGLTRGQAGRLFGVGPRNWRRIEQGRIEMRGPLRRLLAVARALPDTVLPVLRAMEPDATTEGDEADG